MIVLGIGMGIDSGAALIKDGEIIAAVNEERINRRKFYIGFPRESIKTVLRIGRLTPSDLDLCALPEIAYPLCSDVEKETFEEPDLWKSLTRLLSSLGMLKILLGSGPGLALYRHTFGFVHAFRLMRLRGMLKELGITSPVATSDHHTSHGAACAFASGWDEALVVTMDSSGDGYCSKVFEKRGKTLVPVKEVGCFHSFGIFYAYITLFLGHKPGREGKVMGLSARGDWSRTLPIFRKYIEFDEEKGILENKRRGIACDYRDLTGELATFSREDVAAGLQKHFEESLVKYVSHYVKKTGLRRVALAGGVFANVRVNQRIREAEGVEEVFVFPHMGDGGGGAGGALWAWAQATAGDKHCSPGLGQIYLGPSFTLQEVRAELEAAKGIIFELRENISEDLAGLLKEGKVVALFRGRMEYGPRALGNRSILYHASDKSVNDWLNRKLKRTEYMPFAPAILEEHASRYLVGWSVGQKSAHYMTICYDATDAFREQAPAVVHIDGSVRPQVLRRENNPFFHDLISRYCEMTGHPFVLNTSFNMHEEPIVCTVRDAIEAFKSSQLDALALEDYLVFQKSSDG